MPQYGAPSYFHCCSNSSSDSGGLKWMSFCQDLTLGRKIQLEENWYPALYNTDLPSITMHTKNAATPMFWSSNSVPIETSSKKFLILCTMYLTYAPGMRLWFHWRWVQWARTLFYSFMYVVHRLAWNYLSEHHIRVSYLFSACPVLFDFQPSISGQL